MRKQEEFNVVLSSLRKEVPEARGSILASPDGLSLAFDMPESEAPRIAAMAATALGLGKRIVQGTQNGNLQEIVVRGSDGYLTLYAVGTKAVLAVSAQPDANLGLLHLVARQSVSELEKILGQEA